MTIYRPRAHARLFVANDGTRTVAANVDAVELPIRVRHVSIERNDHNHADTASITAEWRDAGVDPRLLKNASVEIYIDDADDDGNFTPSKANLRFVGVMTRPRRVAKEGSGFQVDLEFHDFTEPFLQQKPFPTKGLPALTDSLIGAWQKICDHTGPLDEDGTVLSSVQALRDRIEFRGGVDPGIVLSRSVANRFAKLSSVAAKDKSDAWSVWQQCVGMLGLISFIEDDACVVTTSTEHFGPGDAPKMIWGHNILELEEETNAHFSDKGVAITSFDPLTGTTLEAFFPPPGDKRIRRRRLTTHKKTSAPSSIESERYDFYEYHGVTDPDRLLDIAERVWFERSIQELTGKLRTGEMRVGDFDLLSLRAGDNVTIAIDPIDNETLGSIGSANLQVDYLLARGYTADVAQLIVRHAKDLAKFDPTFHATRVRIDLAADGDAGNFGVEVDFCNRITLGSDSDAQAAASTDLAAFEKFHDSIEFFRKQGLKESAR